MKAALFVHGTGVRFAAYEASARIVEAMLQQSLLSAGKHPMKVERCLWGDSLGSRLNNKGASIPNYAETGGGEGEEAAIALWDMLQYDPLYELRGLGLQRRQDKISARDMSDRVSFAPSTDLTAMLCECGIDSQFPQAQSLLVKDPAFVEAVQCSSHESDLFEPLARALVAEATELTLAAQDRVDGEPGAPPGVLFNATLRDETVRMIACQMGEPTRSLFSWTANRFFRVAQRLGVAKAIERRRGALSDGGIPAAGDVLLYQANGQGIRSFIKSQIAKSPNPLVIIAHSLGGIACVDLLVQEDLPGVALLVTVGSQAPFFYEIGALQSLRYGEPLPLHFPNWLNIYDPRDLLSYLAEPVMLTENGWTRRIVDHKVHNRLPFPQAHSGYWSNDQTWKAIVAEIP